MIGKKYALAALIAACLLACAPARAQQARRSAWSRAAQSSWAANCRSNCYNVVTPRYGARWQLQSVVAVIF